MKKKQDYHKQKYDPSNGTRNEWVESINDEIDNIILDTDSLADEFELPESYTLKLEKIFDKLKEALREQIQGFSIDTAMVINDDDLLTDILSEIERDSDKATETQLDIIHEIDQFRTGIYFPVPTSLVEQMKIDSFLSEMYENPYQLKLIA